MTLNQKTLEAYQEGFKEGYDMAASNYSMFFWNEFPKHKPKDDVPTLIVTEKAIHLVSKDVKNFCEKNDVLYFKAIDLPLKIKEAIKRKKKENK